MKERKFHNFDTEPRFQLEPMLHAEGEYRLIDLDQKEPNPHQPSINYSQEALEKLTQSIQENGMIQPIFVQRINVRYQIVTGERRWRAHQLMNNQQIEAIVKSVDDQENEIYALAANIAREDLSDYEIGKAIRRIEDNFPNKKELAHMIGINRTDMYRFYAFEALPDFILKDLDSDPNLLSRSAAEQIKQLLSKLQNSSTVLSLLENAWELLKDGKLQQTKITRLVEKGFKDVCGVSHAKNENEILNINGQPIGQVTQSKKHWTVQLDINGVNSNLQQ